jgi:hypothetical protein
MSKAHRNTERRAFGDTFLAGERRRSAPHEFVLDAIAALSPWTRPMFGCLAIYIEDKIVLILRDKKNSPADNGVWVATTAKHHASLRHDFPRMRSIRLLGKGITNWQVLPVDAPDFEETALRVCELILARDGRIGKVPDSRAISRSRRRTSAVRRTARRAPKPYQ